VLPGAGGVYTYIGACSQYRCCGPASPPCLRARRGAAAAAAPQPTPGLRRRRGWDYKKALKMLTATLEW